MLPRFFATLRFALNDNLGMIFTVGTSRNYQNVCFCLVGTPESMVFLFLFSFLRDSRKVPNFCGNGFGKFRKDCYSCYAATPQ